MCLLALEYRTLADAPILVAANREEYFNRPATAPTVQTGRPRVLCGLDSRAGGTWLGVNEHGLLVAVTNRLKRELPEQPRSRGLLCRELLACPSAEAAAELASRELSSGRYAGANYLCVDKRSGIVIEAGDRLRSIALSPGLHLLTNGDLNDREDPRQFYVRQLFVQRFPSQVGQFITRAKEICATGRNEETGLTVILRGDDRGTVSSTLVALARRPEESIYLHAAGPPDRASYEDYSGLLRSILGS
ncbi:MAG: NRDE family protein [Pirellulales bacterium]|nr:NRDE family protein [Pirellulales bacterium]